MTTTAIKNLIRLWSKQGLLTGDLNAVQQYSVFWLLSEESEQNFETMKLQVLATNPEVYKAVFDPEPEEEEWLDMDDLEVNTDLASQLAQIHEIQTARETF